MTGIEMQGVNTPPGARLSGEDTAAAVSALIKWLSLAATPAFAIMALLTGLKPGEMDSLCSAGPAAPLSGMAAMYLLMSVFHLPPWLKLIVHRRALPRGLTVAALGPVTFTDFLDSSERGETT